MENYTIQEVLGDGAYGTVYKAVNKTTLQTVAIKKMKQPYATWEECISLKELKCLRKLSHINIVQLKEVLRQQNELYFIFEYMQCNLYQLIKNKSIRLPEPQIRTIAYHILKGLSYIHEQGYFHRDMKPENILISDGKVKIADFGLVKEIRSRPPFTDYVSTRWYRAPELLLKSPCYGTQIDIFALAVIIAELYMLKPLLPGSCENDQLTKILDLLGTPSEEEWPDYKKLVIKIGYCHRYCVETPLEKVIPNCSDKGIDLLKKMLSLNPLKRPTAKECLMHPYFDGKMEVVRCDIGNISKPKIVNSPKKDDGWKTKTNEFFPKIKSVGKTDVNFKPKQYISKMNLVFPPPLIENKENLGGLSNKHMDWHLPSLAGRMPITNKKCKSVVPSLARPLLGIYNWMDIKKI